MDRRHDAAVVGAGKGLAQGGNLVGVGDQEGLQGIGGVLDHLRLGQAHAQQRCRQRAVELGHEFARARVPFAHHDAVGVEEIGHRAALAEEFRVHGQAELPAGAAAAGFLQRPAYQGGGGARHHGAFTATTGRSRRPRSARPT